MERLLAGIPGQLNCDYLQHRGSLGARCLTVFAGPIDEYFEFDRGRLKYRGQKREHEWIPTVSTVQPCGQVNNPDPANGPHIRTLEWKHRMRQESAKSIPGTILPRETAVTPSDPDDYEYPFPDEGNARLYRTYSDRAGQLPKLLICGRLGEYRYYDLDQAIARAMLLARKILDGRIR